AESSTAKTRHHLLLPASPDGRDLGPRLAAVLDRDFVASAIRFDPTIAEVTRFGGRVTETLHLTGPVVATLQPGVRGVEATGSTPAPTVIPIEGTRHRTEPRSQQQPSPVALGGLDPDLIEELPADPSTMDLAEADRIIGGGAGLGSPEAFETLRRLADRLGASTGGTRVVTDWGWLPVERQIGTTGVTVDPSLYVAFGISGAVQHTAGLGSPTHVISINLDPHCPMMGMADLAIVCDGPAVLDRLLTLLDR
ncbi:MAG: mycofactocin-associated electron transfer flavoprotein alpha subunit, partial [Acidimicrobiales bacterium]